MQTTVGYKQHMHSSDSSDSKVILTSKNALWQNIKEKEELIPIKIDFYRGEKLFVVGLDWLQMGLQSPS